MVEMKHPEHLLLVDGHSLAYRAFYALPLDNFATSAGQPTNAVFGFTSMLINAIKDEKPTHLAIAFDVSRETFRKEMFAEYKANRAKSPDEFRSQLPLITEVIKAMQIPGIQLKGFEADDIIATLAKQGEKKGMRVSILTGDRDSYQLVNDSITVLYARKGVSDIARMTPQAVLEKYDLTPEQYPDFAALRGDPSDNLPSVPSVGEKTAVKWIKEYGNLDELIKHADQITGKVGEALRANIDQVKLNRRMTELVKDVTLDISVDQLAVKGPDVDEVNKVFTYLETWQMGDKPIGKTRNLLISPINMRNTIIQLINNEVKFAKLGKPTKIIVKLNSLSDHLLIDHLYKALKAGVEVHLIIRGILTLKKEAEKLNAKLNAISIVDQYLEHARVMIFHNKGNEKVFISSADWMVRNLDHRIEVATPILDAHLKKELIDIINIQLKDNNKARILDEDLNNNYVPSARRKIYKSQVETYHYLIGKKL